MSHPSNNPSLPSGAASTTAALRLPPDLITYSYDSRTVYVATGETYDRALDIAQDTFLELRDVDRDQIRFEVRVMLGHENEYKTAEISRRAWPVVIRTFARFAIVEIRVASAPLPQAAAPPSFYLPGVDRCAPFLRCQNSLAIEEDGTAGGRI